jgi:hypothetical protein
VRERERERERQTDLVEERNGVVCYVDIVHHKYGVRYDVGFHGMSQKDMLY